MSFETPALTQLKQLEASANSIQATINNFLSRGDPNKTGLGTDIARLKDRLNFLAFRREVITETIEQQRDAEIPATEKKEITTNQKLAIGGIILLLIL